MIIKNRAGNARYTLIIKYNEQVLEILEKVNTPGVILGVFKKINTASTKISLIYNKNTF